MHGDFLDPSRAKEDEEVVLQAFQELQDEIRG